MSGPLASLRANVTSAATDGVDDDVEMNFRADVQKRSAERAQQTAEEVEAAAAEPKFEGTDPDDSAFDEIEQSLKD